MAIDVLNLVQGPATVYYGDFGATEPADSAVATAPSGAVWTDVGATDGGVTITIGQTMSDMMVDQVVDVVGRRRTGRTTQVGTNLAEATLNNLKLVLNGGTIATGSGYSTYAPDAGDPGAIPTPKAILIDGYAPGTATAQKRRRVIIRKAHSVEAVGIGYTKDGKTVYPVTFAAMYVSSAITPFHVVDEV